MSNRIDSLPENYTIDTPEHVSFGYQVAGIGNRFIAALIDTILIVLLLAGLNILLVVALAIVSPEQSITDMSGNELVSWAGGIVMAFYSLLNFILIWGYYLLFEWLWHGQTPGKRLMRIRVVGMNGRPSGFVAIVIRNLVRVIDFLPMGYGVGLVSMFADRYVRRLGDFAAGTLVVKGHREVDLEALLAGTLQTGAGGAATTTVTSTLPHPSIGQFVDPMSASLADAGLDKTTTTVEAPYERTQLGGLQQPPSVVDDRLDNPVAVEQRFAGLRHLSIADRDLVAELLSRRDLGQADDALVERVAIAIARKIGQEQPADSRLGRLFLEELVEAYRHFEDRTSS